jgi:hypothetical protein
MFEESRLIRRGSAVGGLFAHAISANPAFFTPAMWKFHSPFGTAVEKTVGKATGEAAIVTHVERFIARLVGKIFFGFDRSILNLFFRMACVRVLGQAARPVLLDGFDDMTR